MFKVSSLRLELRLIATCIELFDNPVCFSVIKEVVFVEPAVAGEYSQTAELQETDSQTEETDNSKTDDTSNNGKIV